MARDLVQSGLALWEDTEERHERLIVKGRANLLNESSQQEDLERIKNLFDDLERKRDIADFLELTEKGEGVRIFIGSENKLFSLTGSSLVVSPYMNSDRKIIGAVGVIGPTRLNYGRIVPVVDYTAQLVGKMISDRNKRWWMAEQKKEEFLDEIEDSELDQDELIDIDACLLYTSDAADE